MNSKALKTTMLMIGYRDARLPGSRFVPFGFLLERNGEILGMQLCVVGERLRLPQMFGATCNRLLELFFDTFDSDRKPGSLRKVFNELVGANVSSIGIVCEDSFDADLAYFAHLVSELQGQIEEQIRKAEVELGFIEDIPQAERLFSEPERGRLPGWTAMPKRDVTGAWESRFVNC